MSRKANVDLEGKFSFPAASTVGLEDEVVACCCSRETKALFGPWLGSPLSVYWRITIAAVDRDRLSRLEIPLAFLRFLWKLLAAYRLERAQIQYNEIQCAFRFVFS